MGKSLHKNTAHSFEVSKEVTQVEPAKAKAGDNKENVRKIVLKKVSKDISAQPL